MARLTAAQRRADALVAARRLIVTQGTEAASVRNVAEEAGMSAGSLRHIFPSHEDLFIALLQDAEDSTRRRIGEVAQGARSAGERGEVVDVRAVGLEMLMQIEPFGGGDGGDGGGGSGVGSGAGDGSGGTRSELLAQLAVLTANPGNARLAEIRRVTGEAIDGLCVDVVRGVAEAAGVATAGVGTHDVGALDVDAAALELRLIIDGISLRALENPDFTEADARGVLTAPLDRLVPPAG
ncbi:helix-turn-helix domain-containing protein [uncultured Corynebacterium sp.]|uniref:helix-turn-helix domain-containing protein n=1 Tax=uncultured Corynebacterium sp. TaxID=159447 RepID=UPI0025D18B4A|nr:helix-turn-helix domain-containing protein [uncultured Corynebacterium sp.]